KRALEEVGASARESLPERNSVAHVLEKIRRKLVRERRGAARSSAPRDDRGADEAACAGAKEARRDGSGPVYERGAVAGLGADDRVLCDPNARGAQHLRVSSIAFAEPDGVLIGSVNVEVEAARLASEGAFDVGAFAGRGQLELEPEVCVE